jgi:hypothetical protein
MVGTQGVYARLSGAMGVFAVPTRRSARRGPPAVTITSARSVAFGSDSGIRLLSPARPLFPQLQTVSSAECLAASGQ